MLTQALDQFSGQQATNTPEAKFPFMIRSLKREAFLDFLMRFPMASQSVIRELSLDYNRSAQQLRTLGLTLTARVKLAKLFLSWGRDGKQTKPRRTNPVHAYPRRDRRAYRRFP